MSCTTGVACMLRAQASVPKRGERAAEAVSAERGRRSQSNRSSGISTIFRKQDVGLDELGARAGIGKAIIVLVGPEVDDARFAQLDRLRNGGFFHVHVERVEHRLDGRMIHGIEQFDRLLLRVF